MQLSRFCHAKLEAAERRIEILNERGEVRPAPSTLGLDPANRARGDDDRWGAGGVARRHDARGVEQALEAAVAGVAGTPARTAGRNALQPARPAGNGCVRCSSSRAAEACGARLNLAPEDAPALAMPAACAIELIHTYSLIHDDLPSMDNDTHAARPADLPRRPWRGAGHPCRRCAADRSVRAARARAVSESGRRAGRARRPASSALSGSSPRLQGHRAWSADRSSICRR